MKLTKKQKIAVIIVISVAALAAILYFTGFFNKKYKFEWSGGQRVSSKNDNVFYAGLFVPDGFSGIAVGDSVKIESDASWIAGVRKVIMLGSDDGYYKENQMLVVDVEDKPGKAGEASGYFKKA